VQRVAINLNLKNMKYCDTVILKIASRCNINCSYCYMYNLGDESFKRQPKFMSEATMNSFVDKIIVHCKTKKIERLTIIFHGGEPLLVDKTVFVKYLEKIQEIPTHGIELQLALQSNGILLDKEWCEIFNAYKVGVGISLDGPENINDAYRKDKSGNGTYSRVVEGVKIANQYLKAPLGMLSVINYNLDPIDAYKHVMSLGVKSVDFLKLDKNYDSITSPAELENTATADWFIKLFDYSYDNSSELITQLRIFNVIMHKILGGKYSMDFIGDGDNNGVVIETNGELEAVDVLKACGDSFTKTNLNIATHDFDDILDSSLAEMYYYSNKFLPRKCLACPVKDICGGGYLPHRYSAKNGFNNPSVYCNSLMKLITHIQNRIIDDMPAELLLQSGIEKITYEEAQQIIHDTMPLLSDPPYVEKLESFRKKESVAA
jgi:uncharacterized protein